jgi:hypothetical protein
MSRSIMNSYLNSPISVTVHSLQNGEEQQFATNYFKSLRPDAFQSVWKYEVTYKGTDSEKQMFIMVKPWESRELLFEDQVGVSVVNVQKMPRSLQGGEVKAF